jgi:hypothetical protein
VNANLANAMFGPVVRFDVGYLKRRGDVVAQPVELNTVRHLVMLARATDINAIEKAIRREKKSDIVLIVDSIDEQLYQNLKRRYPKRNIYVDARPNLFGPDLLVNGVALRQELDSAFRTRDSRNALLIYSKDVVVDIASWNFALGASWKDLRYAALEDVLSLSAVPAIPLGALLQLARALSRQA